MRSLSDVKEMITLAISWPKEICLSLLWEGKARLTSLGSDAVSCVQRAPVDRSLSRRCTCTLMVSLSQVHCQRRNHASLFAMSCQKAVSPIFVTNKVAHAEARNVSLST